MDEVKSRSGSQKRKVTARIAINCTPAQKAAIMEKIDATGLSPSAMCLAVLLDVPLPRRRLPSINDETMKEYFMANGKLADALWALLAELGKSGANINQIAYMLNAMTAPARILNIIETCAEEHRLLAEKCKDALDDMDQLRTVGMQALGAERQRKPRDAN